MTPCVISRSSVAPLLLLVSFLALLISNPNRVEAATAPTFAVSDANGVSGSEVVVSVKVSAFSNISTFQFSFHWNASHAAFMSLDPPTLTGLAAGNFGTTRTNEGILNVSWDDLAGGGQSLADGTTLFAVHFHLIGPNGSASDIVIDGASTPIEVSTSDGQVVTPVLVAGHLVIGQANTAPVLAAIGNKTVNEGTLLTFTNSATDADAPAQTLTYSLVGAPTGAAITGTGVFTWTPTEAQGPGSYPVTIRVTDSGSPALSDSETITITVNEVNTTPVLAPIGNKTVSENALLTFTNSATDADVPSQTLSYSLIGAPSGASINPSTGVFTWTPTSSQGPNSYQVTILVTDNGSPALSDSETITITVNEVNNAPVLAPIGNKTVNEGTLLTFTNSATDPDLPAQTLTYSLTGMPAGATINAATGVFLWTPTEAQGSNTYTVTIVVTDNGTPVRSDSETITITVNEVNTAPVLAPIGDKTVTEGNLLTFTNSASDADLPAQTLTYTLVGAPSGAAINPASGVFTWTPTLSQGPNTYTFAIRVADNGSPALNDSETITVTVNEFNTAPVLNPIGNKTVNEGTLLTFTNSSTDADVPAQTLTYSLVGAPAGAAINPASGVFTWAPTEAQGPSNYPVTIRVTDSGSPALSDSETITITVNEVNTPPTLDPIGNRSVNEGNLLTFTASATDTDLPGQVLTYSLINAPAGAVINSGTGVLTWTPTEAQGSNSYTFTVRATDNGSPALNDSETITVTVHEVNLAPVLAPIGNKTINEGVLLTFTNSATDPDLPVQTLSYSLVGAPAGATINAGTGVFTWTPTEAQGPSNYPVTIRVTDNGSPALTSSETITITVNEVNLAPVLAPVGNKTVNEGTLLSFTNSVTDFDLPAQTLTYSLIGAPLGANIDAATGVFTWTPSETQGSSNYPVTIRVTDNGSPAMSDSETITISVNEVNNAPVLNPIGNKAVNEGTLLTFTNSSTDADVPAQTLSYSLLGAPTGAAINAASGVFTWTPTEAQGPGNYSVTIRVTDNGSPALTSSETINISVNEINTAPVLPPIGNKTISEGALLTFTNLATDSDLPAQTLTYSLVGAPAGATINAGTGVFTWRPPEASNAVVSTMGVVVSDGGSPSLSATQSFTVTVTKTNSPPVFAPLGPYTAQVLLPLRITNMVTDPDLPTNLLSFAIVNAPKGARINRFTGVTIWAPARNQARSTNVIVVSATDDGIPPLSATNSFQVIVDDYLELALGRTVIRAGQSGSVPLTVTNTTGVTNLTSLLVVPPEHLTNLTLSALAPEVRSGTLAAQGPGVSKLSISATNSQIFQPAQVLGQLNFTAISTQSAFVPLLLSNVTSIQSNGLPLTRTLASAGRVVVVANEPLVEALLTTNAEQLVVLYGQTGSNYVVQSTPYPAGPTSSWQLVWQGRMTNLFQFIQPPVTNSALQFYRSLRQ